jgi:hypothetical protein
MKSSNSLEKRKYDTMSHLKDDSRQARAKQACILANETVKKAVEKCVFAGHALIEWKNGYEHGTFLEMLEKLQEVSVRTAQRYMVAARNVTKAIGEPPVNESGHEGLTITEILETADDELPADLREWKAKWFTFLTRRTVNECIAGVMVDGDEAHRIERAINGSTKGGAGGDRKDFSMFVARKLGHACAHLGHWEGMTESQRSEIKLVVAAAIGGGEQMLKRDGKTQWVKFEEGWPEEVCVAALEAIKDRLKKAK